MLMASEVDMKRHALRLAKQEWGGTIKGMKLQPLAPSMFEPVRDDESVSTVEGAWFAVATEPQEERHVSMGLCAIGVPYLPVEPKWENHGRGQQRVVYRPFITGYLFLKCVLTNENWHAIMATRGVRRMLSDVNSKPLCIRDREMDAIRAAEGHFFWEEQERKKRAEAEAIAKAGGRSGIVWHFSKGDVVKISKGPLAGFYAELTEAVDPHDRIRAVVKLFASSRVASLSAFDLERPES